VAVPVGAGYAATSSTKFDCETRMFIADDEPTRHSGQPRRGDLGDPTRCPLPQRPQNPEEE
jgi:hypothetical protein